jgi:hypothetical protein
LRSGVRKELVASLTAANVYVSVRGSAIRVAPHVYNDDADISRPACGAPARSESDVNTSDNGVRAIIGTIVTEAQPIQGSIVLGNRR